MLKASQESFSHDRYMHIQYKDIAYPRIIIKSDMSIFVRVPLHFSEYQTQDFISKHRAWIETNIQKIGENSLKLQSILNSHTDEILIFGIWENISQSRPTKIQLKNMLSDYIRPRTQQYANIMGVEYHSIKITYATSRFGSCTYDNRLLFSFMLIFARKELIDYVIIHELAHIRYKNHSRDFWLYVTQFCQNAKLYRRILREEAKIYPLLLKQISHKEEK